MHMNWPRQWTWRIGRKLYCSARGDLANDPEINGEYWLLNELVHFLPTQAPPPVGVLMDVGANKGEWSLRAVSLAKQCEKQLSLHAFEPCAATRRILEDRLSHFGVGNVEVFAYALSSTEGEADFFSNDAGSATNSLNVISGPISERVPLITLDRFAEQHGVDRIAMLKIDTEGYDCDVLRGARRMLIEGRIDVMQFEYNWRWLLNKSSLLEVFTLVEGMPYRFGKLNNGFIEFYHEWHFELDKFFENNYVLVRAGSPLERLGRAVSFDSTNAPQLVGS